MNEVEKKRAGDHAADLMSRQGWDPSRLAAEATVDVNTVKSLLAGARWPRAASRIAIEEALGMDRGELERVARGIDNATKVDAVERAIDHSSLRRADKAELKAHYFRLLDEDEGRRTG